MEISVMLSNFRQPVEGALETAASLGIPAVQISVGTDEDAATRAKTIEAVRKSGLKVSAISGDFGDWGAADETEKRIETAKQLIDVTREFDTTICQTHIGIMPHSMSGPRWDAFLRCGDVLVPYAEAAGVSIALETGPEPARVMEALMRHFENPALRVNYDPANLIIWPAAIRTHSDLLQHTGREPYEYNREEAIADFEPVEGVKRLGPYIIHTHAKDAVGDGRWEDVPLGEGWIDWGRYLRLLKEAGYDGYLGIEREGGDDRVGEIGHAVRYLQSHLSEL